jgi:hypothetical protein
VGAFMPLYQTDDGRPITTQSMIKTFRMCPREAMYKYHDRLKPKKVSKPLTRGKWAHSLLEEHYKGGDWKIPHKKLTLEFSKLFDEEKEHLGDLPRELDVLMASYFWHYGDPQFKDHRWTVHEVEKLIEADMPSGHLFRGKVDMIVEDQFGLWLVDHKTHGRMPDWEYRMLDEQSTLYTWAARENGIPVRGFIWNYLSTAGFPKYPVLKNGKQFYSNALKAESTAIAFKMAIDKAKLEYPDFAKDPEYAAALRARMDELKKDRWKGPHEMPTSPYFRRDVLEKSDKLIDRVLKSVDRTSVNMHAYDFTDRESVERDINACKGFFCSYKSLSMADLVTGDSSMTRKRDYIEHDPLAYHEGNDELK